MVERQRRKGRKAQGDKKKVSHPSEMCDLCGRFFHRVTTTEVWVPATRKTAERDVCHRCKLRYSHWIPRRRGPSAKKNHAPHSHNPRSDTN